MMKVDIFVFKLWMVERVCGCSSQNVYQCCIQIGM